MHGTVFFFDWEVSLMEWLQNSLHPSVLRIVSAFSFFGEELLMIFIVGFLYWCYNKRLGKYVALNLLIAGVCMSFIKNIFVRRRPYFDNKKIQMLRPVDPTADIYDITSQGFSFPSGHSTLSVSLFGAIAIATKTKILKALAVLLPLLVGFSRILVGAHYPTDVLAGYALGSLVLFTIFALMPPVPVPCHAEPSIQATDTNAKSTDTHDRAEINHSKKTLRREQILAIACLGIFSCGLFFCNSADYFSAYGLLLGYCCASFFEEHFVKFTNTSNIPIIVMRLLLGGILYLALNYCLKLPFSPEFLASATRQAFLIRACRYTIIAFVEFGLYPLAFKPLDKIYNQFFTRAR